MPIKEWRTAQRVLVVPDGRLHLLPFDALLTQNAIVGAPIVSTVPSANVFVQLRSRQRAAKPERALWESEACRTIECSPGKPAAGTTRSGETRGL
jgi:hypothetical protein